MTGVGTFEFFSMLSCGKYMADGRIELPEAVKQHLLRTGRTGLFASIYCCGLDVCRLVYPKGPST